MTTVSPLLAIVVLNWNGKEDTLACLESVRHVDCNNFKVIIVDNGSTDGSQRVIRSAFPQHELIEIGVNLGFAGGNNIGIQRALEIASDYILLLNNDTVVDADILNAFVSAAQRHPEAGAFSARIYFHHQPDTIWYAGAIWMPDLSRFTHVGWSKPDNDEEFGVEGVTDYACGCAFFVPAKIFREVGLLDERFFLTFEETDWCYRARKAGHPSIYVPTAKLWHKVSASFGGANSPLACYFMTRNSLLWASKHLSLRNRLRLLNRIRIDLSPRFEIGRRSGAGLLRSLYWGVVGFCQELKKRAADKVWQAHILGIRDYFFGRLGHQTQTVERLTHRSN